MANYINGFFSRIDYCYCGIQGEQGVLGKQSGTMLARERIALTRATEEKNK